MKLVLLLAASLVLTGCGESKSCYVLTDSDLLQFIQRGYADSRMTPEMARNFRFEKERVIGVERSGSRGEDAHAGMLFRQDDGTILSIRLFEDCTYSTSPGIKVSDLRNWAYPLTAPRF